MRLKQVPMALIILLFIAGGLQAGIGDIETPYRPGIVVFSILPEISIDIPLEGFERSGVPAIDRFMDQVEAYWIERMFPYCLQPVPGGADLTIIYTLYFPESLPVDQVWRDLSKLDGIEYAEPWYVQRLFLEHNDPNRRQQYYLDLIQANDAHDLCTGDRTVPVAIIDTGVDMDHVDLVDNIWINPGEDLNGNGIIDNDEVNNRDDDDNGRIDDFWGWDFYGNGQQGNNHRMDNNPNDISGHGTHCSGIASAVTNNRRGIASIGYSCGIMPVRAGNGLTVVYGYNGIEYAARTGAKVISCSWGSGQYFRAGENVAQYAYDHDAMLIAAAGNGDRFGNGIDDPHYPAAYDHVIAVAATNQNDVKPRFSNFGEWVDVSAPGVAILSTVRNNGYQAWNGTSMSCPLVAGTAVLIRAAYPWLNVDEATELLLEGADNIDDENRNYEGELGAGRINAYESLLLGARPMLTIDELEIITDDNENEQLDPGETVSIAITISNSERGMEAEDIVVTISSEDPDIAIEENEFEFPNLEAGEEFTNNENPFVIVVDSSAIPHTTWFTVEITAEPALIEITRTFEILVGHPDILVVDDDGGSEIQNVYFEAIENMDMGWAQWNVELDYSPDFITLTNYEMVVWVTGRSEEPLDDLDRIQIEMALDEGANILLIGHKIGDDRENRSLLRNYFGAHHQEDSVRVMMAVGISDKKPIDTNVRMYLYNSGEVGDGRDSPSTMSPVNDADSLVVYEAGDDVVGLAGVYRAANLNRHNESRTIHLGFAFESVNDRITPKHEVLRQLHNWFTSEMIQPHVNPLHEIDPNTFVLNPAYPNPFNSSVRLSFSLPVMSSYKLIITDLSGREIALVESGIAASRKNAIFWNADAYPSGTYLVRLTSPGFVPMEQRLVLIK